jgi:EKC/KEOPS complex subunit CGI121/TPRKB
MTRLHLEQHPDKLVDYMIFRNVRNISELISLLKSGKVDSVLLSENMIVSPLHLAVAANRALHNQRNGTMRTKNINTEIILCLSPNNNISQSLTRFGLSANSYNVISLTVADTSESLAEKIQDLKTKVKADLVNDCRGFQYDDYEVYDVYGISKEELSVDSLENSVITRMATKV